MDAFVSSSEAGIEEEVTRPIDWDRTKTAVQKGKGKEDSSSQNESSSVMTDIMSTLKKLGTSFTRAQMWKQYNKLRAVNTTDMDAEELMSYRETLRLIKKDFNFTKKCGGGPGRGWRVEYLCVIF
jgi:hypothetical protein